MDSETRETTRNPTGGAFRLGLLALAAWIIWIAYAALLAILAAIVIAVLLDAGARGLVPIIPGRRKIRMAAVLLLACLAVAGGLAFGGAAVVGQAQDLMRSSETGIERVTEFLREVGVPTTSPTLTRWLPDSEVILGGATQVASNSFGIAFTIFAVLFLAAFMAWDPDVYRVGFISLFPRHRRIRIADALSRAGAAMRMWATAQLLSMAIVGVVTYVLLIAISMPYPGLLSLQAGLLAFVPTIGPFAAGIVIVLAGLSQSPTLALYGLAAYALIQFIESNLATPLIQERMVRLPPALTLGAQMVLGALFGFVGLIFAVPLVAACKALIQDLYIEDKLGGPWSPEPGS